MSKTVCSTCGGTGKTFEKKCSTCHGNGTVLKIRLLL